MVATAKITRCVGLKGFVRILPLTSPLERLTLLRDVLVGKSVETIRPFTVETVEIRPNGVVMKLATIDDRNAAETLLNEFVFVEDDSAVRPRKGSYFVHEILGCDVWTTEGRRLGILEDIFASPAHDLWAVRNGDNVHLIPAVTEFIRKVDLPHRKIVVRLIEGLVME